MSVEPDTDIRDFLASLLTTDDIHGPLYKGTFSVHDGSAVPDITADRIARVDAHHVESGDYAETDLAALIELTDGTWATCVAWCDTTGWDCQAAAHWKWSRTREDAIRHGLDRPARLRLGVELPEDAR